MKLLFLMNHVIMGGLEKVLLQYLTILRAQGIECVVVSRDKVTDEYFLKSFNALGVKLVQLKKPGHSFVFKIINRYVRRIKLHKYTAVIDFANFAFKDELQNVSKRKIGYCHGSFLFFESHIDKRVLDIYDDIVCLSDSFMNDFMHKYPEYKQKVHHIYNPIDITNIQQLATESVSVNVPYFVAVQRLDSVDKDVATIIKAFNKFCKDNHDFYLYIIGDGPQKTDLEILAQSNRRIIFLGKLDNPYPFIKNANALILS